MQRLGLAHLRPRRSRRHGARNAGLDVGEVRRDAIGPGRCRIRRAGGSGSGLAGGARQRSRNSSPRPAAASPSTSLITSCRDSKHLPVPVLSRRGSSSRCSGVSQRSGPMSPPPQKASSVVDDDHLLVVAGAERQRAVEHEATGVPAKHLRARCGKKCWVAATGSADFQHSTRMSSSGLLAAASAGTARSGRSPVPRPRLGMELGVGLEGPVEQVHRALGVDGSRPWRRRNSRPCRSAGRRGRRATLRQQVTPSLSRDLPLYGTGGMLDLAGSDAA